MAELSILAKATIILASGLAASRCARRASAAVRAAILASTFAALLLLPLAGVLFIERPVVIPVTYPTEPMSFFGEDLGTAPAGPTSPSPRPAPMRLTLPRIETMLRAVWIAGAIGFIVPVVVALARLGRVRRRGRPWTDGHALVEQLACETEVRRRIAVFLSGDLSAPMTCGWWRPAIGLPRDAAAWPHADVRRALRHELEHVRRRDWPVHLLARLVCAMYWFHPLGWIAWRQLSLECERACDDAVLREEEQTAYANQLVLLARRLSTDAPMPMLSMANRSHLSTRVGAVLATNLARGRASALMVTSVCVGAVAVMLAISPLQAVHRLATPARETNQAGTPRRPVFAVASIESTTSTTTGQTIRQAGNTFIAQNVSLRDLVREAYRIRADQLSGADGWIAAARYDVEAKPDGSATWDEQMLMLQAMLEERFKLRLRRESREATAYALVVGRTGSKLRPAAEGDCPPDQQACGGFRTRPGEVIGRRVTLPRIAAILSGRSGRLVIDATGITGTYDFDLTWTPEPGQVPAGPPPADLPPPDPSGPSLFTALDEQLGLRLQPSSAPVDHLTIEHAERPSPNDAPDATPAAPPQAAAPQPTFEVTSIRRNTSGQQIIRGPSVQASGRVLGENLPVRLLIATAFGIEFNRVVGGPEWVNTDGYDLDARAGVGATQDQIRAMLRTLLVARFGLVARRESDQRDVYTLVRVRNDRMGPQLRVSGPECAPIKPPAGLPAPPASPPPPPATGEVPLFATATAVGCPRMFFGGYMAARRISMFDFANALTGFARRPVIDGTGLTEAYDLDVTFTPEFVQRGPVPPTGGAGLIGGPASGPPTAAPAPPTDAAPTLFTALQEQLGLRLEPGRGAVEVVMIDRVERPTEN